MKVIQVLLKPLLANIPQMGVIWDTANTAYFSATGPVGCMVTTLHFTSNLHVGTNVYTCT